MDVQSYGEANEHYATNRRKERFLMFIKNSKPIGFESMVSFGLLFVIIVLAWSIPISFLYRLDEGELNFFLMSLVVVIYFLYEKNNKHEGRLHFPRSVILLFNTFLVTLVISSLFSIQPGAALYAASYWIVYLFFVIAVAHLSVKIVDLDNHLSSTIVFGLLVYLSFLIIRFYFLDYKITPWDFPVIGYVRAFGILMGGGALMAYFRAVGFGRLRLESFVYYLSSVLLFTAVFWSGTRTAIFAGFFSLATVVLAAEIDPLLVWGLALVMYLIMGCFILGSALMLLTLPVVYPLLVTTLGFDGVWLGVMLVMMVECAAITPPVGMNLYVLQGVTGQKDISDVSIGSFPFFLILVGSMVIWTFFPQAVLALPNMMFAPRW